MAEILLLICCCFGLVLSITIIVFLIVTKQKIKDENYKKPITLKNQKEIK